MKPRTKNEAEEQATEPKIDHLDFNLADFRTWCVGRDHEEVGRVVSALALASEAGDESYLEQFPFVDRIIYGDGTWKKVTRGNGTIDNLSEVGTEKPPDGD
jgi:hypothetical protein